MKKNLYSGLVLFFLVAGLVLSPVTSLLAQEKPSANSVKVLVKTIKENRPEIKDEITIPVITGSSNKNAQKSFNQQMEKDILKFKASLDKEALEFQKESKERKGRFIQYTARTDVKTLYNKNNILSIAVLYYQFTGGAHGATTQVTYNFDLTTGQVINLKNLFKEGFDYKTAINQEVNEQNKQRIIANNLTGTFYDKTISANFQNFYFQDNSLVMYFQPYDIDCYAAGIIRLKVPFSKLSDGLKDRFSFFIR